MKRRFSDGKRKKGMGWFSGKSQTKRPAKRTRVRDLQPYEIPSQNSREEIDERKGYTRMGRITIFIVDMTNKVLTDQGWRVDSKFRHKGLWTVCWDELTADP